MPMITKVITSQYRAGVRLRIMSTGTSPAKYNCAQCEQPEGSCQCEKFCCLCQSVIDVRICQDGLMYCEPCRTACDYKTSQ
jgi:hypothetical protein